MYDQGYQDGYAGREPDEAFTGDSDYAAGHDVGTLDRGLITDYRVLSPAYRAGFKAGWRGKKFPEARGGDSDYTTGFVVGRDRKAKS